MGANGTSTGGHTRARGDRSLVHHRVLNSEAGDCGVTHYKENIADGNESTPHKGTGAVMITRRLSILVGIGLVVTIGCASTPKPDDCNQKGADPNTCHGVDAKTPDQRRLERCKELVKNYNDPLIIAVRVAMKKAAGTPVEAIKIADNGQTAYHVRIQNPSGHPTLTVVGQPEIAGNKIDDPSSTDDCRPIYEEIRKMKLIKAMGVAQTAVPGSLEKATLQEYEGHTGYSVITKHASGTYHLVRVDSDSMKILKREVLGH